MKRTLTCVDCGGDFDHEYVTGSPPQRCTTCRPVHQKAHNASRQKAWRDANQARAREHWNKSNRKRLADPDHRQWKRDDALHRAYGITRDELNQMIEDQCGKCAICGGGPNGPGDRLHIDHCHDQGHVRGLLCGKCNTAVGLLDNDPERAESLARYLRR